MRGSKSPEDWEDLSDWYDKKQGESGDLWHRALIDPVLLKLIGDCKGSEVLDLGCGNGYLARRLARTGARVTAVDSSSRMIRNARAHDPEDALKVRYVHSDASRLVGVEDASFDLVFANMSLMDIEDAGGAVGEVGRVLRRGGRFVASICHPCFDTCSNSGWVAEKVGFEPARVYRRVRGYRTPFSEGVPWRLGTGGRKFTRSFHRPLSWYARVLRAGGLAITALEEPEPSEEFLVREREKEGDLDGAGFLEVPLHLVVEAVKP
ncbi:MAG: class I SAM-dependent methyltransferase [Nitrososphaerota archaeon]|nr:class I SAM-dependent methyltransferase [Nitrososphaerota archaeon]